MMTTCGFRVSLYTYYHYYPLFCFPLATLRTLCTETTKILAKRVYADRHLCAPFSYLVPPFRNMVLPHAVITHTETQLRIIDDGRPRWRRGV